MPIERERNERNLTARGCAVSIAAPILLTAPNRRVIRIRPERPSYGTTRAVSGRHLLFTAAHFMQLVAGVRTQNLRQILWKVLRRNLNSAPSQIAYAGSAPAERPDRLL
jgi:hypothetical protein